MTAQGLKASDCVDRAVRAKPTVMGPQLTVLNMACNNKRKRF